jgi:hypothetical protein
LTSASRLGGWVGDIDHVLDLVGRLGDLDVR